MNNCTINTKQEIYNSLKNNLLSVLKINRFADNQIERFFSMKKIFDEQDQKYYIAILKQDEDLKENPKILKAINYIEDIWKKEYPQKPTIHGIDKEYLDINLDTPSSLSKILSLSEAQRFLKEVQKEIISNTFFNGEKIIDENTIHQAIFDYQYTQLKILNSIGTISGRIDFRWAITQDHYNDNYRKLIENVISKINSGQATYEVKKALLILTNLDTLIEQFHPFVKVLNASKKGKVRCAKGKYSFVQSSLKEGSYDNEEKNVNINRITSDKLKAIIETIPRSENQYISMDFFYEFVRYASFAKTENFLKDAQQIYQGNNLASLTAFVNYLNAYKKAYDEKLATINIANKGNVHQNINLIDLIQNYIDSIDNIYYLEISKDGLKVTTKLDYKDSKYAWRNAIMNKIKTNFKNNTILTLAYNNLNIGGLKPSQLDNNDLDLLRYLELLTGISLSPSQVNDHFSIDDRHIIGEFLEQIQSLVRKHNLSHNSSEESYRNFENDLVRNGKYIALTNILTQVEAHVKSTLMSQDGRELSGTSIHHTMGNFKVDKEKLKPELQSENILYNEDQEDANIGIISSIQGVNPLKFYKPTELEPFECATAEISKMYYNPNVKKEHDGLSPIYSYFQIDAYSDKPRIFAGSSNITHFLLMSEKQLYDKIWNQRKNYYEKVTETIIQDFVKLGYEVKGSSIVERYLNLFKQLENQKISDLAETIIEKKVKLVKDFHYCEDKKGNIYPNPRLFYHLKMVDSNDGNKTLFKSYIEEGLTKFLERMKDKSIGIDFNEVESFWRFDSDNDYRTSFLKKYYLIRTLVRDAYLQITIQSSFFHDNKGELLSVDALKTFGKETLNSIKKNIIKTSTAGKKRGNFAGASYSRLLTGQQYTMPKTIKMATIDEPKEDIFTYFGTKSEKQSLHDGAIFTPAIVSEWETKSQLNVTPKGTTRKYIFLENNLGYCTQIKCADNVISNSIIRNGNPKNKLLLKKAYRVASLDSFNKNLINFYTNNNRVQDIIFDDIYRKINGRLCKLIGIESDGIGIKFNWVDAYTGTNISITEANNLFDSKNKVDENGYWNLENLYDLWQAFGGEFCLSYVDGEITYSEVNNKAIANLISFLDCQDIKENVISKLVNPSSIKSGKTNINSEDRVNDEEKDLMTFSFDASKYGLQQDYAHESNESESPFPTQVLSALAFNGENIEACNRIYEAVGWLIRNNLSKLPDYTNIKETNQWLGKKLLSAFESAKNLPTNGEAIIKNFLQDLSITLPASDPNIYYKISQQILSDLNNTTIRQKLPGAGLIQCPSKQIVLLYEDNTGKKYTRTQLFEKYGTTDLELLEEFIKNDDNFKPKEVEVTDLNIEDTVIFENKLFKIKNPGDLYKIYDTIGENKITKIYTEPRDLATSKITWEVNGKKYNYWLLPTTRAMFDTIQKYGEDSDEYKLALQEDRKIRRLIKNKKMLINDEIVSIENYKYQAGEQIAPKIYKNRMNLGNKFLSDITEEDFLDKINNFYFYSTDILLSKEKQIYCVCQAPDDFNSSIKPKEFYFGDFEDIEHNVYIDKNNNVYSENNEFLFTLPFDNSENVIINAEYNDLTGKIIVKVKETNEDRIEDYLNIFDPNESMFYSSIYDESIEKRNKLFNPNNEETKLNFAKSLYNSFILSNTTLSLRIPTQAFQSFMVSETVAFLESDENLVYNNIWEMIFQGSDFDIDKAYTIMYGVDNNGLIKGNTFTDYNSIENIIKSLQLPLPNYSKIDYSENDNISNLIITWINNYAEQKGIEINSYEDLKNSIYYYDIIATLINHLNNENIKFEYNEKNNRGLFKLIKDLNEYNGFKTVYKKGLSILKPLKTSNHYIKNIIVQGMLDISSDIANLEASSKLMVTKPMTKYLSETEIDDNEDNPFFIWEIQNQNAVGKVDVGIAANGIKVASTLQQFYNKEFLDNEDTIKNHDLNISIMLNYDDDGKPVEINKVIHHIANLNLSDTAIKKLYDTEDVESIRQQLNNTENVAFNLSILLSLAVDNAKELALAKMYGFPDLLKFHVALAVLGFSAKDIVKLSTKYLKLITDTIQKQNRILYNDNKINIQNVIQNIEGITSIEKKSLIEIFNYADELTNLAQLLKINQGVNPNYYEFSDFTKKFVKGLSSNNSELNESSIIKFMQKTKSEQLEILNKLRNSGENPSAIRQLEIIVKHPLFKGLSYAIFKNKDFLNHISAKTLILDKIKSEFPNINDRSIIKIIDDYVIGQALLNLKISLNPKQLKNIYNVPTNSNILNGGSLKLTNNNSLQEFISIMNNYIIPKLKEYYENNYFFKSLYLDKNGFYTLPFNSFSADQSPLLKQNLNLAKTSFDEIASNNSYLNFNDIELTIGDLFQLYQLIANKNSFGNGLKYCVENSFGNLNLYKVISNIYSKLDEKAKNNNEDLVNNSNILTNSVEDLTIDNENLTNLIKKLTYYVNSINNNDYIEFDTQLALSTTNGPIITFNQIVILNEDEIKNKIKTYFNDVIQDLEINEKEDVVNINVELKNTELKNNKFTIEYYGKLKLMSSLDITNIISTIENQILFSEDKILSSYNEPEELVLSNLDPELKDLIKTLKIDDIKIYQVNDNKNLQTFPKYFKTIKGHCAIVNSTLKKDDLYKIYFKRTTGSNNHTVWLMQLLRDITGKSITFTNYKEVYKQVLKESENDQKIRDIINILLEDAEFFKATALEALNTYQIHLRYPNIFYVQSSLEELQEGYIIESNNIEYIYLGKNADNNLIVAQITDVSNIISLEKSDKLKVKSPLTINSTLKRQAYGNYEEAPDNYQIQVGDKINNKVVIHITTDSNNNTYYIVENNNILERISKSNDLKIEKFEANIVSDFNFRSIDNEIGLPGMEIYDHQNNKLIGIVNNKTINNGTIKYYLKNNDIIEITDKKITYISKTGESQTISNLLFKYSDSLLSNYDPNFFNLEFTKQGFPILKNYFKKFDKGKNETINEDIEVNDIVWVEDEIFYKKIDDNVFLRYDTSNNNKSITNKVEGFIKAIYVKNSNNNLIKINSKINSIETVKNFLNQFVTITGVPITIDVAENVQNGVKAEVNQNGIIIYIPSNIDTEEDVMKTILEESTHEYLHILLAFIRKSNPTKYYDLIESQIVNKELSDDIYLTEFSKKEEIYVRSLTEMITKSIYEDSTIKFNELISQFNNTLSDLFNCEFDISATLFDNLKQSKFVIKDIINFDKVKKENISLDEFNKIKRDCQ